MFSKKIGLLTFHRVWNAGAFLQALALYEVLQEEGHNVCVLDYVPDAHKVNIFADIMASPLWFIRSVRRWAYKHRMARIYAEQLKCFELLAPVENGRQISKSGVDVVISSADVWNYGTRWSAGEWVLFGKGINVAKLIGYSVSLGNTDPNQVSPPKSVTESLPSYNCVFPRDHATRAFALNHVDNVHDIVLDAAFFLDYKKHVGAKKVSEPYIAVYALPGSVGGSFVSEIKDFAKSNGLKIVTAAYSQKWADLNFIYITPFEWLSILFYADFVFTNTFHGTVFSILMRKKFSVELSSMIRQKTKDMIDVLGVSKHVYRGEGDLGRNLGILPDNQDLLDQQIQISRSKLINELDS